MRPIQNSITLGDKPKQEESAVSVGEEIDSYANVADAQTVMRDNRDQLADCHSFVGSFAGDAGWTFTHKVLSLAPMGDESVNHQLDGISQDKQYYVTWNIVEVRSANNVLFLYYSPSEKGTADTESIATKAMAKARSALQ